MPRTYANTALIFWVKFADTFPRGSRVLKKIGLILWVLSGSPFVAWADDFVVYSVERALDFGIPGQTPEKDFFVNMGTQKGLKNGSSLEVYRKAPSYDVKNERLYQDVTFPFARLRVIHVESNLAIARLEKFLPADKTPHISPPAVMVGDLVKKTE